MTQVHPGVRISMGHRSLLRLFLLSRVLLSAGISLVSVVGGGVTISLSAVLPDPLLEQHQGTLHVISVASRVISRGTVHSSRVRHRVPVLHSRLSTSQLCLHLRLLLVHQHRHLGPDHQHHRQLGRWDCHRVESMQLLHI